MEAWIVAVVAVLTFLYQALIGTQSIWQWYRRQERSAEDKQVQESATLHLGVRGTLSSAIADGIRFVQEHPVQTVVRVIISMVATLIGLIVVFLFIGALLWLIGSAFSINATVAFGEQLMSTGGKALGATVLLALGLGILVGLFFAMDGGDMVESIYHGWMEHQAEKEAKREAEKEKARRKAARAAKARARQTVP